MDLIYYLYYKIVDMEGMVEEVYAKEEKDYKDQGQQAIKRKRDQKEQTVETKWDTKLWNKIVSTRKRN